MSVTRPQIEAATEAGTAQVVESLPPDGQALTLDSMDDGLSDFDAATRGRASSSLPTDSPASRQYMVLFERATGIIGVICLVAGLADWGFQPHSDHRAALVILVCAMFLAILHYYSLEDTRNGDGEGG